MPWETQSIGQLNGLNQDENPHVLAANDMREVLNVARYGRMVGTRPGTQREASGKQYENALTGANAVQGLHEHREDVDSGRHLLAVSDDGGTQFVFYEDAARLPNGPTITAGQNNVWTFANHRNLTWAAGGAVADDLWHWDGDTGAAPTALAVLDSAGANVRPSYVISWRNHLLLNGLRGGVLLDNNPSTTRFVEPNTDPTDALNWKTGNTIGFNAYGESYTTGFASYRDNNGDFLLILNSKDIAAVELTAGFPVFKVADTITNGCVHQRAFVSLGTDSGDAVFMSGRGIHSLRQSQAHGVDTKSFLSWKIRAFMDNISKSRRKYSVGAYDFTTGRVVFAVSTGSSPFHDRLLVLDIGQGGEELTAGNAWWTIWSLGTHPTAGTQIGINDMKMMRDEDGVWRLYFGTTDGDVGYFTEDAFHDLGSAGYSMKLVTAHNAYGSTLVTKTLGDVMVTLQPGGAYRPTMRFHFDYGARSSATRQLSMPSPAGGTWGSGVWGTALWGAGAQTRDEKVYGSGSGRTISFEVTHSGTNEPVLVGRIEHQVDMAGEDTGDVSNAA